MHTPRAMLLTMLFVRTRLVRARKLGCRNAVALMEPDMQADGVRLMSCLDSSNSQGTA